MKKLYLYTIFHGNLSFSSIPQHNYPKIIDRCYWPLLDLVKKGHKIGLEFPSATLRIIKDIDSSFIRELTHLWERNACEVVGSGFTQNIFPLIPYEVNKANLEKGMRDYEITLGRCPEIAFINEQTYSGGLPSLYAHAGFKSIIMDWDNAAEYQRFPPELRYRPVLVEGVDGTRIPTIWNSSLNSYKFQRCIYNRMTIDQYIQEVMNHFPSHTDRALILYGTDLEMFNYRPVTQEESSGEIEKIGKIFSLLNQKAGISFINPSDVLHYFELLDKVTIESPECPIPCKNRDDYNVIRWGASGRDNVWFNTECYKLYNKIQNTAFLSGREVDDNKWEELNALWSSDLRTKTTNEKHYDGKKKIGEVSSRLDKEYNEYCSKIHIEKDFVLFNPHVDEWDEEPYEIEFHFAESVFYKPVEFLLNGKKVLSQIEEVTRYKNGSIRTLQLVCLPLLGPFEIAQGEFIEEEDLIKSNEHVEFSRESVTIETPEVNLELSQLTGGDVRSLTFPSVHSSPLIGYLSPVYFDHVGHSSDYYSMGIQVEDKKRGVINDTKMTRIKLDGKMGVLPIRVPFVCKIPFEGGIIWKKYYVYQSMPRIDLSYTFYLDNISPDSFRLAIMTINPESFMKESLRYSTVNGTPYVEHFYVRGKKFHHNQPVGSFSSGRCCLGATEGWIDISDGNKGIALISNKSELYSVPMLEYEEVKKAYLLRVYNSISESDETGKIQWRGHSQISFSLHGHNHRLHEIRKRARHKNNKLVCIYRKKTASATLDKERIIKNLTVR